MTDTTEDTNETNFADSKANFTNNITEAINKIKGASDDAKKRFEEIREENGVDSNDLGNATQIVTEYAAAAAASAKAAYEKAGGIEGISTAATQKAAELTANAKILQEDIANSDLFKKSVDTAKTGAGKISETGFFKTLIEQAKRLSDVAHDTYKETYDSKRANADE